LAELPTHAEWSRTSPETPPRGRSASSTTRPLLHPTEPSRLALAIVGALLAVLVLVLVVVGVANVSPAAVGGLVVFLALLLAALWFGQQLLRARLLGRSLRVGPETFPELQALFDEVRTVLDYHRRVDVYVIDKADAPISMTSYLGTRIILLEGGLAAELSDPKRRPHLLFLLGRSIGSLKAKHARLDLLVVMLQAANALRYMSVLLLPWYRATTYSGDQIGMACCGSADAALEATRRLLVGKELASDLGAGIVLSQALLVQTRILPRLIQLFAAEPHLTNRYANLVCFVRYHDPEHWERIKRSLDEGQGLLLEQLWRRSPHRRRLAALTP
jgi:hypothetical protein